MDSTHTWLTDIDRLEINGDVKYACIEKGHLVIIDEEDIFTVSMTTHHKLVLAVGHHIISGLKVENYIYCLRRGVGLVCYDITQLITSSDANLETYAEYKFEPIESLPYIDRSGDKLLFFTSFESMAIVPLFHQSTVSLEGMRDREEYLSIVNIGGKCIGLRNKRLRDGSAKTVIESWSMESGRQTQIGRPPLIYESGQELLDLTEFSVFTTGKANAFYSREWTTKILIMSNK